MTAYQGRGSSDAVLSLDQLKRLASHRYSASGQSFLEPYMQVFWRWLVEQIPLWWAPNAITLAGLIFNGLTTFVLMIYSPDCKTECPQWSYLLCAFGMFFYQSMDAIDGKQARRTHSSSPLGELFDHGCDAISMVFIATGVSVSLRLGTFPELLFVEWFAAVLIFYAAHWQTYCSGVLQFGKFDVTEGQLSAMAVVVMSATFGSHIWDIELPSLGIPARSIPALLSIGGCLYCCTMYFPVLFTGGVGKNGSTVAGTSVVSPGIPVFLLMAMAVYTWRFSTIAIFERHSILFLMTYGFVASKLSNKLVIAHLSRSEMNLFDSSLVGPLVLTVNLYFGVVIDEYYILWFALIYSMFDLLRFATAVCRLLCGHLGISCFHIDVPKSSVTLSPTAPTPVSAAPCMASRMPSRTQHQHGIGCHASFMASSAHNSGSAVATNGFRH